MLPSSTTWKRGAEPTGISQLKCPGHQREPHSAGGVQARSAVGKGRQSRDAGEQVILTNVGSISLGCLEDSVELVPWGEGSLSRASSPQLPSILWEFLPLPHCFSACPSGGQMCLWPGEVQASSGLHGGRPGEQVEPLCCSVPRGVGLCPSPGSALGQDGCTGPVSCPGSSPCEWESGGGWGFSGRVLGRAASTITSHFIAAGSRAGVPIPV